MRSTGRLETAFGILLIVLSISWKRLLKVVYNAIVAGVTLSMRSLLRMSGPWMWFRSTVLLLTICCRYRRVLLLLNILNW